MEIQEGLKIWPFEKVMACLERIVHTELMPSIPEEEYDIISKPLILDDIQMIRVIKFFYKKSNKMLEIYRTPEDMMKYFEKLDGIPEFIKYSMSKMEKNSIFSALLSPIRRYSSQDDDCYVSKRDNLLNVFKKWVLLMDPIADQSDRIVANYYKKWMNDLIEKKLAGLEGSFDLIPEDSYKIVIDDLKKSFESKMDNLIIDCYLMAYDMYVKERKARGPEGAEEGEKICEYLTQNLQGEPIEIFKKNFGECVFLVELSQSIFDRHAELFTPFSKLPLQSKFEKPVIRRFKNSKFNFFLNEEVDRALKLVLKNGSDLIVVKSENEKKLGIVHGMDQSTFEEVLKKHRISSDLFVILQVPIDEDFRNVTLPIISSYGTHCIPAMDAFDNIIYYLAVILKVFQRSNNENREKIVDWIENLMENMFVEKPVIYLIETWKIDEIIEKARKELNDFLTEPVDDVPPQESYNETEMMAEFEKLTKNLGMDSEFFNEMTSSMIKSISHEPNLKNIYICGAKIVRVHLSNVISEIKKFEESQSKPEPKKLAGLEKGFLNKKEEASSSKMLQEELAKLKRDAKKNEDMLKTEIIRSELARGSMEQEMDKLQKELKKTKSENSLLEHELEGEKAKNTKLEKNHEKLEKLRFTHLEVIQKLENMKKETDCEMVSLRKELESEKVKNLELAEKSERLEKERDELRLENEKLQEVNSKHKDFQEKIKESKRVLENGHSELVDGVSSRLMRLSCDCPESSDAREAKTDVLKLEDCLDEYLEIFEKEYRKLRE